MKGLIIINPYKIPYNSVIQAERLSKEFRSFGVEVDILTDGYTLCHFDGNKNLTLKNPVDFIIYLDKDKYLSAMLEKCGARLFNSHNAIRISDEKGDTEIALSNSGVNMPKTIFAPVCYKDSASTDKDFIEYITSELNFPIVVKESYGSMGKGVYLAKDKGELISLYNSLKTKPHLYQNHVGKPHGIDIRVIVIGKKAVAIMKRENLTDFRSNVGLGGKGYPLDINDKTLAPFISTAEKVADIINLDYCGVDLLIDDNGAPVVCEVNSNAFFMEMESATGINVASLYARHVIDSVNKL